MKNILNKCKALLKKVPLNGFASPSNCT